MTIHSGNGNGKGKNPFEGKTIDFPVTFTLKAVMDATISDDDHIAALTGVFELLDISHNYKNKRLSSKGNYVSFTYLVTLVTKQQMDSMYGKLKQIKGLKFAL